MPRKVGFKIFRRRIAFLFFEVCLPSLKEGEVFLCLPFPIQPEFSGGVPPCGCKLAWGQIALIQNANGKFVYAVMQFVGQNLVQDVQKIGIFGVAFRQKCQQFVRRNAFLPAEERDVLVKKIAFKPERT